MSNLDPEEQKRFMYDKLSPRRKKFIDRIGYDKWDPFQEPKDPIEIRKDPSNRTTQQLVREFLQTREHNKVNTAYSQGVMEMAIGLINRQDRSMGALSSASGIGNSSRKKESTMTMNSQETQAQQEETVEQRIAGLKAQLQENPTCGNHHYNLGVAYLAKGDWVEAERSFLEAVQNSPTLVEAYVQLGGIAMHRGDLDGCLNYNQTAADTRPMFATPYGNIGFVHMQRGDLKLAIKALEKAVKLDGNFVQALATLGTAYLNEGDPERALTVCQRAVEREPMFGPAYNNMAIAYLQLDQTDKAVECVDKALETGLEVHPKLLEEINQYR